MASGTTSPLYKDIERLRACLTRSFGNAVKMGDVVHIVRFQSPFHSRDLLIQLAELRDESQLCDVTLVVQGTRINAHRNVLAASSNYFRTMFTIDMVESRLQEVELIDVEATALDALVKFCYTGKIEISDINVLSILPAACLLQLTVVQTSCCDFLKKKLNPSNCLEIRALADTYACQELLSSAQNCILRNFQSIVGTENFYQLSFSLLVGIISSDELVVKSEEQVFAAALKWTKFDLPAREQMLPNLLEHVRLPLCHPKFLVSTVSKDTLVMANATCRELVDEAKNYLLLQLPAPGRPSTQGPRTRPRKPFRFPEVLCLVGGFRGSQPLNSVEWIDPGEANLVWKPAAPMSKPRFGSSVAVLDNILYAVGGHDGRTFVNSIQRFDNATGQWSSNVASMSTIRESCGVAALDGFLYAVGGVRGTECLNVVERYDPRRNEWTHMAPTRSRRCGVSASVLNGCLYAVGGRDGWLTWSTVERFDPRVGKWEDVCPMSTRRSHSGSAMFDGHLYVAGGQQGTTPLSSAEKYNHVTNGWIAVADLINEENTVTLADVNEKLYAVGSSYIEVYDKELNFWKNLISIEGRRSGAGVGVIRKPCHPKQQQQPRKDPREMQHYLDIITNPINSRVSFAELCLLRRKL